MIYYVICESEFVASKIVIEKNTWNLPLRVQRKIVAPYRIWVISLYDLYKSYCVTLITNV
jgi:hypothetical protein